MSGVSKARLVSRRNAERMLDITHGRRLKGATTRPPLALGAGRASGGAMQIIGRGGGAGDRGGIWVPREGGAAARAFIVCRYLGFSAPAQALRLLRRSITC